MTTKHYCDLCDDEIPDGEGYTVMWEEETRGSGKFTATFSDRKERNVCDSCWPGEEDWFNGIRGLIE